MPAETGGTQSERPRKAGFLVPRSISRWVKRVPLDFDAPLFEVWKGYRNPFDEMKCTRCIKGKTPAYFYLQAISDLIEEVARAAQKGKTPDLYAVPFQPHEPPTVEFVEARHEVIRRDKVRSRKPETRRTDIYRTWKDPQENSTRSCPTSF